MRKLTAFEDYVMEANARVADKGWRLGQALMKCLPEDIKPKVDCFYDDSLVGAFLTEVYPLFIKETEVAVWSRETIWNKRVVKLDCSFEEAKKMGSKEFHSHIVEWIDVLDTEFDDLGEPDYDIDYLEYLEKA